MRFLQQALESVVQLDAVARELISTTHHRAPEWLLGVRHEAHDQFVRREAFHQALGIGKIRPSFQDFVIAQTSAWDSIGHGHRLPDGRRVIATSILGGLHHEYCLEPAA